MTSMNVVLRPSTKVGNHKGSLSLRFIHQRKVKVITLTGCRLYPYEWDRQNQHVIYPEDNPKRVAYLEELEQRVRHEVEILNSHVLTLQAQGHYTVEDIARLYHERRDDGKLLGYADALAKELEQRGQERTAQAYRTVTRGIVKFNDNIDIPLHQINSNLIKRFEAYLKDNDKMPNTIAYYMRNLRAIYNKAVNAKRIINNYCDKPFAGVYTGSTKTTKRALSVDELQQLSKLDFHKLPGKATCTEQKSVRLENLSKAWRYFFFCFLARGMCFIDLAYLRKENIKDGVIKYCRKKTGAQIEVHIKPEMRFIIDSFATETAGSPYVFPIIQVNGKKARLCYESALRTQNNRLKILAKMAEINKPISTHVSRHSWATVGKQQKVDIRVISDGLGHTSEKTTEIYLGTLESSELDHANDIIASAVFCPSIRTEIFARV